MSNLIISIGRQFGSGGAEIMRVVMMPSVMRIEVEDEQLMRGLINRARQLHLRTTLDGKVLSFYGDGKKLYYLLERTSNEFEMKIV